MTTPTGAIGMADVNTELGKASTANITLNDANVRSLAGASATSGTINSMNNLRGKSSYTAMTASGVSDINQPAYSTFSSGGTATANPSVSVSGGSGGYTYSWSITSNAALAPTLSNTTSQSCTLSRTFTKSSNGSFDTYCQCVITDNTGHTTTVSNVEGMCSWGTAV